MDFFAHSQQTPNIKMSSTSLKDAQKNSLLKMINLNEPIDTLKELQTGWKVFIYDKFGQQIISPSMRLGELRNAGVTLHM
jgi:hypothetical protein